MRKASIQQRRDGVRPFLLLILFFAGPALLAARKTSLSCILPMAGSSPGLSQFLKEISQTPLLSREEERELAIRRARGLAAEQRLQELSDDDPLRTSLLETVEDGETAREKMILANLRLVVSIAKNYMNRGLSLDDLIAEGNLGLIRAVDEFDLRYGTRFSTYATYWIKQAVRKALMETGSTIRIPAHVVTLLSKFKQMERSMTERDREPPTFERVTRELKLSESQTELLKRALKARGAASLQDFSGEDQSESENPALARTDSDEELDLKEDVAQLERGLAGLDERLSTILRLRFFDGKTLTEVGEELGVSKERIRQLEGRGLRELEKKMVGNHRQAG